MKKSRLIVNLGEDWLLLIGASVAVVVLAVVAGISFLVSIFSTEEKK